MLLISIFACTNLLFRCLYDIEVIYVNHCLVRFFLRFLSLLVSHRQIFAHYIFQGFYVHLEIQQSYCQRQVTLVNGLLKYMYYYPGVWFVWFTCWQMFLYWYSPSFAMWLFLSSTQSSRYSSMIGSWIFCHVRCFLLLMTSYNASRALCFFPTSMNSKERNMVY